MTQIVNDGADSSVGSFSGGAIDSEHYKRALGKFPTGVAVVTARGLEGKPIGMTVNSFVSISLTPAVIAWSLRLESSLFEHFAAVDSFTINVLAANQKRIADQFASRLPDRFVNIDWEYGWGGSAVLAGGAAVFECDVLSRQEVGDHMVVFGKVIASLCCEHEPLIMYSGKVQPGTEAVIEKAGLGCVPPGIHQRNNSGCNLIF